MQFVNSRVWRVCLVIVACSVSVEMSVQADDAGPKCTLQYRFLETKVAHYTVENQSKVELHQGEAEQVVEHSETTDKHYRVGVDLDGDAVLEMSIDRVQMSASVDGGDPVKFDSLNGDNPPVQFEGVANQVGQPHVRVKVAPTGEVLSLQWLLQADTNSITAKNAGGLDILVRLPEEPVAIGDKWKEQYETDISVGQGLNKAVTMQRTYELKSVEGDIATIRLDTAVITPLHDPEQEAQLIQKTPSGTIKFDIKRGIMLSRETSVDRKVVGFSGPNSFVRNVTSRKELFVEGSAAGAVRQAQGTNGSTR